MIVADFLSLAAALGHVYSALCVVFSALVVFYVALINTVRHTNVNAQTAQTAIAAICTLLRRNT